MVVAALALAAALGTTEVFTDDEGCRWLLKTAPAVTHVAKPHAPAASAPRQKPAKKRSIIPKAPSVDYEPLDCGEGRMDAPPTAALPQEPPGEFSPIPELSVLPPAPPLTFAEVPAEEGYGYGGYGGGSFGGFGGGSFGGGGGNVATCQTCELPCPPVAVVPEPSILFSLAIGMLGIFGLIRTRS